MKINTNLSSLIVQSNLKASTYGLNTAIERMSTGFKINHAKDNAANYSINTKLSSKLSSYKIAQDNVYMGLDMVMTAMDSLDLISSHLSRMRDLAEQAANGTYGASSLQSIQSEINARSDEITRLVSNTEFNNVKLFDGEPERTGDFIQAVRPLTEDEAIAQGYTIITTADELQAMQYDLSGKYILMNDIDLSGYEWTPVGNNDMGPFKGVFNGNGKVVKNLSINRPSEKTQGFFGYASNAIIKNVGLENVDISCKEDSAGLLACANSVYSNASITNCYVTGKLKGYASVSGLASDLRGTVEACYTNVSISVSTGGNGGLIGTFRGGSIKNSYSEGNMYGMHSGMSGGFIGEIDNAVVENCYSSVTSSSFYYGFACEADSDSTILNSYVNNEKTSNTRPLVGYNNSTGTVAGVNTKELNEMISNGVLPKIADSLLTYSPTEFQVGVDSSDSSRISLNISFALTVPKINLSTSDNARKSLEKIDELIKRVNTKQTEYGAAYNRLESALETIGVSIDNLTSTQSTIRDSDIAEESSAYIRNQILQQAAATLMSTANQTPAIALQLL